jgi:dephospho-CoA kinase
MIIGLTGLIGSGKTTVANCFAKYGIRIIDTDTIAHDITNNDVTVLSELRNVFGEHIFNESGQLNRASLRIKVFSDENKRLKLEGILHPKILQIVQDLLNVTTSSSYTILAVPLLFRSPKYLSLVDRTLFVDSDYGIILTRLYSRSGLSKSEVDGILMRQVARDEQIKLADDVITNNSDLSSVETQVAMLHAKYLNQE